MSWTPYDHEAEERRDSERFADASVFDGPDPSEYLEPEPIDDLTREWKRAQDRYVRRYFEKPGMFDPNIDVKVLLVWLVGILFGLMFWILVGKAIMRWVL